MDFTKFDFSPDDLLVIVDMQNDFKNGPLGTKRAAKITPDIAKLVEIFPGMKILTRDTHTTDYLSTPEGKNLPVVHTIVGTHGWQIVDEIKGILTDNDLIVNKYDFGSTYLFDVIRNHHYRRIYFVGVCTGYCVITNVILAKTADRNTEIYVIEPLCGCATKESHDTAIQAMENMYIKIIRDV